MRERYVEGLRKAESPSNEPNNRLAAILAVDVAG